MALKLLLCLFLVSAVHGYRYFRGKIPNGYNVKVNGAIWAPVGHSDNMNPGYSNRNNFGKAFQSEGFQWTVDLCEADSDGDGAYNGEELGDPDCTWTPGSTPKRTSDITSPGDAMSKPTPSSTTTTAATTQDPQDQTTATTQDQTTTNGCASGSCSNSDSESEER